MAAQTTIIDNFILEPGNMSRYELIYTVYNDYHYGWEVCSITWLKRSRGGMTFVWTKGENIYAGYAQEKMGINMGDLAPILINIKKRFPGSIGELVGFEDYDENGRWRPNNS